MNVEAGAPAIPAHVPKELVAPTSLLHGTKTERDPFRDLADSLHDGPELIYAPNGYPNGTPAWWPRTMADLRAIYLDTEHFSSANFSLFARLVGGDWVVAPAELDPPDHGPFRQLLNPLFTPRAMAALEARIRTYAADCIDSFASAGECEVMKAFAFEFPIKVFLELMGLPQDRVGEFMQWEMQLLHSRDMAVKADGVSKVVGYLAEEIEDRRKNPRDDLLSYAVQGALDGRPLTQDELIGVGFNLFVGGLDTVSANMGLHLWHLAQHPEHQSFLRRNPDRIPDAIDEFMRAYGAVTTFRTCVKETTVRGVRIMPGEKVAMSTTLAGRDPEAFENPGEVRLDRRPRQIAFGYGPHLCIGAHLARRELKIAIEEFLARIPDFRIPAEHQMTFLLGVIQPAALPLVWTPSA